MPGALSVRQQLAQIDAVARGVPIKALTTDSSRSTVVWDATMLDTGQHRDHPDAGHQRQSQPGDELANVLNPAPRPLDA